MTLALDLKKLLLRNPPRRWASRNRVSSVFGLAGVVFSIPPVPSKVVGGYGPTPGTDLTRNTRAPHFTPQHRLLCHMGLY